MSRDEECECECEWACEGLNATRLGSALCVGIERSVGSAQRRTCG